MGVALFPRNFIECRLCRCIRVELVHERLGIGLYNEQTVLGTRRFGHTPLCDPIIVVTVGGYIVSVVER